MTDTRTASADIEGLVKRLEGVRLAIEVTDACLKLWNNGKGSPANIEAALATVDEAATALRDIDEARMGAVVKPLEWVEVLPDQFQAMEIGLKYVVVGRHWWEGDGRVFHAESTDEAKAAAQADFDQRIRSALLPSLPAEQEDVADGGGVLAGWCQPNGITKQAQYDIDQAIGGTYELPDGRSFWLDHVAVKEIMRRAVPYIAAECERHRLAGSRTAKPEKKGGC